MRKLVKGILTFRKNCLADYRERYSHLEFGQSPDSLFIGCSDSRVMPNVFASTNPGDLFVVRNVGNLIPPYAEPTKNYSVAAAIEFSLTQLPTHHIIVCGHSECGAMQAALNGLDKMVQENLRTWLQSVHALDKLKDPSAQSIYSDANLSEHNKLSQLNVLSQIEHLKTYPVIQEKIEERGLEIHGWYFDIATGDVYTYDPTIKRFMLLDEEEGSKILAQIK